MAAAGAAAVALKPRVVSAGDGTNALPLDIEDSPIAKPSVAAAGASAAVAVKPRVVFAGGGGIAVAAHEHQLPGQLPGTLPFQAPNDDDLPIDITDQCRHPPTCVAVRQQRVV